MTGPTPAEHCGHQPDSAFGNLTECVLRPGHQGSHADHTEMRWWMRTQPPAEPARRHTVDTITSDELDQLYAERDMLGRESDRLRKDYVEERTRAEKAEAKLAALHEGEQPHNDERTAPTPAQWIWRWNRATPTRRLEVAAAVIDASERADRCFIENHKNALPDLRQRTGKAEAALERVRAELDRWSRNTLMRGQPTRILDDFRAALDKQQEQ